MTINDAFECLDKAAPYKIACEWDNSGFLIGHKKTEIKKILVSLDCTADVIDEAIVNGCNLIVTHHPYIFKGLTSITDKDPVGSNVLKMIESGISLVCAHTNLDMAFGGINDELCKRVGISKVEQLGFAAKDDNGNIIGECRIGIADVPLSQFTDTVKEALGCKTLKCSISGDKMLHKVAVCSGAGCDYMELAINAGADALLTADAKYHDFQNSVASGFVLIDAGHFETEDIICDSLVDMLRHELKVDVIKSSRHHGFYKYL